MKIKEVNGRRFAKSLKGRLISPKINIIKEWRQNPKTVRIGRKKRLFWKELRKLLATIFKNR